MQSKHQSRPARLASAEHINFLAVRKHTGLVKHMREYAKSASLSTSPHLPETPDPSSRARRKLQRPSRWSSSGPSK